MLHIPKNRQTPPPKLAPKKTTMLIQLDEDLKKQFQESCKKNDFTCSQVLRKLIRLHLQSENS